MSAAVQQNHTLLLSLPAEILLDTLSLVPYAPGQLNQLRLVCRQFNHLLRRYENSLASEIVTIQFPERCLCKFPGLCRPGDSINYSMVDRLDDRLQTLRRIERSCYEIRDRYGKQAAWMIPRWINLQSIGMLLLYRLQDCGDRESQANLLRELPSTSLAVLLFALIMTIHQLRFGGPDILHRQSPTQIAIFRAEIELACEELLLQRGPSYLDSLLAQDPKAIKMLEGEHAQMDARQLPDLDGQPKPPTLIAELRRALATSMGSHVRDSDNNMWDLIDRICNLDAEGMEQVINGHVLFERKRQDSGIDLRIN